MACQCQFLSKIFETLNVSSFTEEESPGGWTAPSSSPLSCSYRHTPSTSMLTQTYDQNQDHNIEIRGFICLYIWVITKVKLKII